MPPVVLTIQHTAVCPPARVGEWLTAAGCSLDVRLGPAGDPLPATLDGVAGLVVLGGEMGAYDDARHPRLTPTKTLLSEAVRRQVPTLAICLGHQLLAVAEGGTVARAVTGPQVGRQRHVTEPAAREDRLFSALGPVATAAHWNNDLVTVAPAGAVALSATPGGLGAFRLGEVVWGVQFHPEVTVDILRLWGDADVAAGVLDAATVESRLREVEQADAELVATWGPFVERFAAVVRR